PTPPPPPPRPPPQRGGQMHPPRQPVPAEQPQPQEHRLQEERGQALHGQGGAEHVADKARVGRPVHAELELLDQPGDPADGDVDDQQRAEEPGQPQVLGVALAVPEGLEDGGQERQPDRQGHEQEVVDGGGGELQPRPVNRRHPPTPLRRPRPLPPWSRRSAPAASPGWDELSRRLRRRGPAPAAGSARTARRRRGGPEEPTAPRPPSP